MRLGQSRQRGVEADVALELAAAFARSGGSRDRARARVAGAPRRSAEHARCAISSSECCEPRASSSMALRYRLRVAKSMAAKSRRGAQRVVDQADALEELRPVDVRHQPHAGDDVAHRDVRCALALVLFLEQLFGARALCSRAAPRARRSAGVTFGSWSRRRCTSCTAKADSSVRRPRAASRAARSGRRAGR